MNNISINSKGYDILDFEEFYTELKKKVELSLEKQDEWHCYFTHYEKELLKLKNQMEKTDRDIDELIYDLYKLLRRV